ncbi:hypothetical protein HDU86_006375 [Geranomyces michiganensis]|nr:hypothetical protein HDU86_006375 [Geranomyces michiganensis]
MEPPTQLRDVDATQLNLPGITSSRTQPDLDPAANGRRLEEGTVHQQHSLKQSGAARGYEEEERRVKSPSRSIQFLLWLAVFVGATFFSQRVQVDGFAPVWLPTGVLAAALTRTSTSVRYFLAPSFVVAMIGIAWLNYSLPNALFSAAISFISGSLLAVVAKRICPGVVNGTETLRGCGLFLAIVPFSSLLEGICFALPLTDDGEHGNTTVGLTALRLFANNLLGSLLVMPLLFSVTEEKIKAAMEARKQPGYSWKLRLFMASLATMAALPFAFITLPSAQYDCAKFFFIAPALMAGYTAGVPGMLLSIGLGLLTMTFVSVNYRKNYAGEVAQIDIVLRLQCWCICLIAAGLLHNATMRELRECQRSLRQLQESQAPTGNRKRPSTTGPSEFSRLLGYVCKEIGMPMNEIHQLCEAMLVKKPDSLHEQQIATESAGRTINRLVKRILPIIGDAAQLANVANGVSTVELKTVNLLAFFEELSLEMQRELPHSRLTTRFNLPTKAYVDTARIRRIFRAMVICGCKHRTSRSRVSIDAMTSTRFSRSTEGHALLDMDMTVTVTDWVLENSHVDYLIRPYASELPPTASSLSAGQGGVDLSMAVATVLARSVGGRLVVYGQYGRGTMLNCKLPIRVEREDNDSLPQPSPIPNARPTITAKKLPPKPPLIRQLTVAATSAAEISKSVAKKLQISQFRRRSKDSALSHGSGKFSDQSLLSENTSPAELANAPGRDDPAQLSIAGSSVTDAAALHAYDDVDEKKCILVVDDSRINRLILSRMLQQYPEFHIQEASDGVEAFNFCMASSYSLILMDLIMGQMDGYVSSRFE